MSKCTTLRLRSGAGSAATAREGSGAALDEATPEELTRIRPRGKASATAELERPDRMGREPPIGATLTLVVESEDLIERCQAGDLDAFRTLFRTHRVDVTRLVHRLLGGSADVEDVVQEVFLQVHRSLKDFRFGSRFSTWLYRVTVNVVLMHRRSAKSRPVLVEALQAPAPRDEALLPDELAARSRRIRALYRLLARLSDKKRVVYVLHELEGFTPTEIATLVGAPVLTVRTRLFYARRELVAMLREEPALDVLAEQVATCSPDPSSAGHQKEPA